jgi:hypothetical protein
MPFVRSLFQNIERIGQADYTPSADDILRVMPLNNGTLRA